MAPFAGGFGQPRVAPVDAIYKLATEQVVNYIKQLYQHQTQHLSHGNHPSAKCALSIAAMYALAHGTAVWPVAVANDTPSLRGASLGPVHRTTGGMASLDSIVESHELDIGGDFALRRANSDTVSEYSPFGSMPSPRLDLR